MGFSITISAFENEDNYRFPRANLRERFSKHLENAYGHQSGFWPLSFSEGPSLAQLYVPGGDMISHFSVQRPPEYLEFWEIIAGILRDFPCLLYWPNKKPVGIIGSLALLPHIPKDFIHHMGIPWVSTDPERIRQYVWDNS